MKLSDFELEVMQLLWRQGECSAPELHQLIEKNKTVTYSTVKTIIDRLEKKQAIIRSRQQGRTIFYVPKVEHHELSQPLLKEFIHNVFGGSSRPLFNHLVRDEELSKEDIDYIQALLDQKKQQLKE